MSRLTHVLLAVLPVLVMAASCPKDPGRYNPNGVDRDRAAQLAADPWLAGGEARHGQHAGLNLIDRESISKQHTKPGVGDPRDIALGEIRAAHEGGWFVTYVGCGPSIPSPFTWDPRHDANTLVAEIDLEKSPADLDKAAFARLLVNIFTSKDDDAPRKALITIDAYVPYHSDKGWPSLPSVAVEATCLVTPAAPAMGRNVTGGFPGGIAGGLRRSQPLNERGEPDKAAP